MSEPAPTTPLQVIVVTGLSGGGKTTALHALEDLGYYCVDNLPAALMSAFADQLRANPDLYARTALGVDARTLAGHSESGSDWLEAFSGDDLQCRVLFLSADRGVLIQRFSETRRRHPLTADERSLPQAIDREMALLEPLRERADWVIDSSDINIHQLRRQVWKYAGAADEGVTIVLESFAFKRGVPQDIDFLFDVRHLPNPHWQTELRPLTGRDEPVREWLADDSEAVAFADAIERFLIEWLPGVIGAQRSYLTIGLGCTGGRHRSVWLSERLAEALRPKFQRVLVHHREIGA